MQRFKILEFVYFYMKRNRLRLIYICIATTVYIASMMLGVHKFCMDYNKKAYPWFFSIITSNPIPQSCFMFGGLLLLCDFSLQYEQFYKYKSRLKPISSILHMLYALLFLTLIYVVFIFIITIVTLIPNLSFGMSWGTVISTLGRTDAQYTYLSMLNIASDILLKFTPARANFSSFMLMWVCLLNLGLLLSAINSISHSKLLGSFCSILLILFDILILNELPYALYRYSPISLTRFPVIGSLASIDELYCATFFILTTVFLSSVIYLKKIIASKVPTQHSTTDVDFHP